MGTRRDGVDGCEEREEVYKERSRVYRGLEVSGRIGCMGVR